MSEIKGDYCMKEVGKTGKNHDAKGPVFLTPPQSKTMSALLRHVQTDLLK